MEETATSRDHYHCLLPWVHLVKLKFSWFHFVKSLMGQGSRGELCWFEFPWKKTVLSSLFKIKKCLGGFPGGSDSKRICLQYRTLKFDPWVGKIPWRRAWQPIPVLEFHSCLENPVNRGAWGATVHGVAKSQTWLSNFYLKQGSNAKWTFSKETRA